MNPEQIKQEQESVLARINAYDAALAEVRRLSDERTARYDAMVKAAEEKGEEWPAIPDPTPEHCDAWEAWADAQKDLTAPTLTRQYAALLTAHAEALEREAALREAIGVYITHVYACLGIDDDKMVSTFTEALKGGPQ